MFLLREPVLYLELMYTFLLFKICSGYTRYVKPKAKFCNNMQTCQFSDMPENPLTFP